MQFKRNAINLAVTVAMLAMAGVCRLRALP